MISGDSIVCGISAATSTTLTLSATPTPPGGADLDVWAAAQGVGLSGSISVVYNFAEFTDATFTTIKSEDRVTGTLTRGASAGIANCTLTRGNTISSTTSMNAQPATVAYAPATGFTVGTAANCLVYLGGGASDKSPTDFHLADNVYDKIPGGRNDALGGYSLGTFTVNSNYMWAFPFIWRGGRTIKKASIYAVTAVASSALEVAIFQMVDHDTIVKVLDLCNSRATLFNTAASGWQTNTQPTFPATFLPSGQYLTVYLATGASSAIRSANATHPGATFLGFNSGNRIGALLFSASGGIPASITLSTSTYQYSAGTGSSHPDLVLGW